MYFFALSGEHEFEYLCLMSVCTSWAGMCVGTILYTRCMCWDHNTDEHGHEACILHTGHLGGPQHLALSSQHRHRQS